MKKSIVFALSLLLAGLSAVASAQSQSVFDSQGRYLGTLKMAPQGKPASQLVLDQSAVNQARAGTAIRDQGYETRGYDGYETRGYDNYSYNGPRIVNVPVTGVREVASYRDVQVPVTQCQTSGYGNGYNNGYANGNGSTAGTLLGSVIGGVLGHQVGHGRGRTAATVGGAVLGGGAGYAISGANQTPTRQCFQSVQIQQVRVPLYEVTYLWNGRQHLTRTGRYPGSSIQMDVANID